jgi:hypothetical protein
MSQNHELVNAFRETVDRVIQVQVEQAGNVSWPDMHLTASVGELLFTSVDANHGRSKVIGIAADHQWAVVIPKIRIGDYAGNLALVSADRDSQALFRNFALDDSPLKFGPDITRRHNEMDDIEAAVQWARSPHLYAGNLQRFVTLEQHEVVILDEQRAVQEEHMAQLERDLEHIATNERQARADSFGIILD